MHYSFVILLSIYYSFVKDFVLENIREAQGGSIQEFTNDILNFYDIPSYTSLNGWFHNFMNVILSIQKSQITTS